MLKFLIYIALFISLVNLKIRRKFNLQILEKFQFQLRKRQLISQNTLMSLENSVIKYSSYVHKT